MSRVIYLFTVVPYVPIIRGDLSVVHQGEYERNHGKP
jgi:hypothetical protein